MGCPVELVGKECDPYWYHRQGWVCTGQTQEGAAETPAEHFVFLF